MTDTNDAGTADHSNTQPDETPLEVVLDTDECVSAGKCVNAAPGFFVFDAEDFPDDTNLDTTHLVSASFSW